MGNDVQEQCYGINIHDFLAWLCLLHYSNLDELFHYSLFIT